MFHPPHHWVVLNAVVDATDEGSNAVNVLVTVAMSLLRALMNKMVQPSPS